MALNKNPLIKKESVKKGYSELREIFEDEQGRLSSKRILSYIISVYYFFLLYRIIEAIRYSDIVSWNHVLIFITIITILPLFILVLLRLANDATKIVGAITGLKFKGFKTFTKSEKDEFEEESR